MTIINIGFFYDITSYWEQIISIKKIFKGLILNSKELNICCTSHFLMEYNNQNPRKSRFFIRQNICITDVWRAKLEGEKIVTDTE